MSTRTTIIISAIAIFAATVASAAIFPRLPEMAASHWNAAGHRLAADVLADFFAPRCGEITARAALPVKPRMR